MENINEIDGDDLVEGIDGAPFTRALKMLKEDNYGMMCF